MNQLHHFINAQIKGNKNKRSWGMDQNLLNKAKQKAEGQTPNQEKSK